MSSHDTGSSPTVDAIALEGAAIVNMLPRGNARTFSDYADPPKTNFDSYVMNQMKHANRIDAVWDTYLSDSLKAETLSKRGSKRRRGIRR